MLVKAVVYRVPCAVHGRFSAERDMSSRHELSGWTGRGRLRMIAHDIRMTIVRTYGGGRGATMSGREWKKRR